MSEIYDPQRNPTVGGARRIHPRYGLLHRALNLRRAAAKLPPGNSAERDLHKLLVSSNITTADIDAHEAEVEANGSPLYIIPKE